MDKLIKIEALKGFREQLHHLEDPQKPRIRICMTGWRAYGTIELRDAIAQEIGHGTLEKKVEIRETGCHGFCARALVLAIDPKGWVYQHVRPEDARGIIEATILRGRLIDRLLYRDPRTRRRLCHGRANTVLQEAEKEGSKPLRARGPEVNRTTPHP